MLSNDRPGRPSAVIRTSNNHATLYRLLLVAVFSAIGLFVYKNLDALNTKNISFEWRFLIFALGLTFLGHLCSHAIWARIATSFDMHTSWSHSGKAWFLSRLGRYIPGKISILLLRFNAYDSHSKTKVSAATVIEAYTSLCAANILFFLFIITSKAYATPISYTLALTLTIITFSLSHPRTIKLALRLTGTFFPVPALHKMPKHSETLKFSLAQLLAMLLHGGALFMTFNAIGYVETQHYFLITVAFFVAGLVGMIAVFSPSGIGVREAALIAMLTQIIDATTLIFGVALIRLVGVASEVILAGLFVAYERSNYATNG